MSNSSGDFGDDDYSRRVKIEFLEGPARGKSYDITDCQSLLVGRDPVARNGEQVLSVPDRALSRHHLRFHSSPENLFYYVEDLDSTNGTELNGKALKPGHKVRLISGDLIMAGRTQIYFVDSGGTEIKDLSRRDYKFWDAFDVEVNKNKPTDEIPLLKASGASEQEKSPFIRLDTRTGKILINNQELKLIGKQHRLFTYLYEHRERVCTHTELIEHIWNTRPDSLADSNLLPTTNNVQQLVREIRKKIDQLKAGLTGDQVIVHNNSLRGYQLASEEDLAK
jgi:pSer/pThr/pTyr-binding forkhead associated (FHA) protein